MDRRELFGSIALTTAAQTPAADQPSATPDTTGHTLQCEFQYNNTAWKVYEDLRRRDGSIVFVPARGAARVMGKPLGAVFSQASVSYPTAALPFTVAVLTAWASDIRSFTCNSLGAPARASSTVATTLFDCAPRHGDRSDRK
jgi:hypothetical protein